MQSGGYTSAEQQRRERLRLEAAGRFTRGGKLSEIAHDLRVTPGSVRRWHRTWEEGGAGALRSRCGMPRCGRYKSTARDLGAFICFEDETGQGLSPPKGRTLARRGARPLVRVRGAGGGRVSIAGVACYRPGESLSSCLCKLIYIC